MRRGPCAAGRAAAVRQRSLQSAACAPCWTGRRRESSRWCHRLADRRFIKPAKILRKSGATPGVGCPRRHAFCSTAGAKVPWARVTASNAIESERGLGVQRAPRHAFCFCLSPVNLDDSQVVLAYRDEDCVSDHGPRELLDRESFAEVHGDQDVASGSEHDTGSEYVEAKVRFPSGDVPARRPSSRRPRTRRCRPSAWRLEVRVDLFDMSLEELLTVSLTRARKALERRRREHAGRTHRRRSQGYRGRPPR